MSTTLTICCNITRQKSTGRGPKSKSTAKTFIWQSLVAILSIDWHYKNESGTVVSAAVYVCTHTRMHIHAYIHTHAYTYIHACMHAYIHAYIHIHIHIHIHTIHIHTYIHTYIHGFSPCRAEEDLQRRLRERRAHRDAKAQDLDRIEGQASASPSPPDTSAGKLGSLRQLLLQLPIDQTSTPATTQPPLTAQSIASSQKINKLPSSADLIIEEYEQNMINTLEQHSAEKHR